MSRSGIALQSIEPGPGWGWASMILPELEQQPLTNNRPVRDECNCRSQFTVRTNSAERVSLPGRPDGPPWTASDSETWFYMGKVYSASHPICNVAGANYIGVYGIGEPGVNGEGVFFRGSFRAFRRISTERARRSVWASDRPT